MLSFFILCKGTNSGLNLHGFMSLNLAYRSAGNIAAKFMLWYIRAICGITLTEINYSRSSFLKM